MDKILHKQITICYEEDDERPKNGWRLYHHGIPNCLTPFRSRRRERRKFRRLHDSLKWAAENCPRAQVHIEVKCYSGDLMRNQNYKTREKCQLRQ